MSNNEISKTLKALYELRSMRAELEDEITALEDKVKSEMNVPAVVNNQLFGWIFGLKNKVRIVGPKEVRERMGSMVYGANMFYQPDMNIYNNLTVNWRHFTRTVL